MLDHNNVKVFSAAWTRCGRLVSGDGSGEVRVWDLKGTPSATVPEGRSRSLCGIVAYFKTKLRVRDLKGTPNATVLEGHSRAVLGIAVSGTRIFSGSEDKTIRVCGTSAPSHTHTPWMSTLVG